MQQEDKKLHCEQHPNSYLSVVYLGDKQSNNSRFLCIECVITGGEQYKNNGLSQLIMINEFFSSPGMHYRKTISDNINTHIEEINKCIKQIAIFLKQFQESFSSHIEQLKSNVQSLRILSSTINTEIEKQYDFHSLKIQYQTIKRMDSFQGTQEYKQIQEDLNHLCKIFPQIYNNSVNQVKASLEQTLKDYKQSLMNIQKDISLMSSINIYTNHETNLFNMENLKDFSFVFQQLGELNFKYQLIYQGTRDGLSNSSYWQKCDLQSHILTIIILKNGNVIGGYSPCQLNQTLKDLVVDKPCSSFLFQQNKQEIYKLKNYRFAIYCSKSFGPKFGFHYHSDLSVDDDFKSISSELGQIYDISGYNVKNTKTHQIGEQDLQIIECKVYKINYFT